MSHLKIKELKEINSALKAWTGKTDKTSKMILDSLRNKRNCILNHTVKY